MRHIKYCSALLACLVAGCTTKPVQFASTPAAAHERADAPPLAAAAVKGQGGGGTRIYAWTGDCPDVIGSNGGQ